VLFPSAVSAPFFLDDLFFFGAGRPFHGYCNFCSRYRDPTKFKGGPSPLDLLRRGRLPFPPRGAPWGAVLELKFPLSGPESPCFPSPQPLPSLFYHLLRGSTKLVTMNQHDLFSHFLLFLAVTSLSESWARFKKEPSPVSHSVFSFFLYFEGIYVPSDACLVGSD